MLNVPNFALPGLMEISRPVLDSVPAPMRVARGKAFAEEWVLPVAPNTSPTGYSVTADVRMVPRGPVVFSFATELFASSADTFRVRFSLAGSASENLESGVYTTDVFLVHPDTTVEPLAYGVPVSIFD